MRPYQTIEDYWRIRAFLRDVYLRNGRRALSWPLYRFDYWRWHGLENLHPGEPPIFLWENEGQIVAVLNAEEPGEGFMHVDPDLRSPTLESEMLAIAEDNLAIAPELGVRALIVWADAGDALRHESLELRGYARADSRRESQRVRSLALPIPGIPIPVGYTLRALGDSDELPARSLASWRAFHPDRPESEHVWDGWYTNVQRAPLYRRDLDLVAVAADGELAAFCTAWFDDVTRTGAFEPVGTVPAHQRRGLGKALLTEGLRRLRRLGATQAIVSSFEPAAHALYASVGLAEQTVAEPWQRRW